MAKLSSQETMQILGIQLKGLNRLRALYRKNGRLEDRELFDESVVREELVPILDLQRRNPRLSFENCYDQVLSQNNMQQLFDRMFNLSEEDELGVALAGRFERCLGNEESAEFYRLFNDLFDFLSRHDRTATTILDGFQQMIITHIILCKTLGTQNA